MSAYPATENRAFNHLRDLERKLETARSTIAEQKKRIEELESAWDQLAKRHAEALTDLTAERQRRENAEAALRIILAADKHFIAAMGEFWEGDPLTDACADARKHFTRYSDAGNDSADERRG